MSPGSSWMRGATPAASVRPVGVGVAGCVGFGAGRAEWAAAGRDVVNGNVCATVAAIRYPPISATAVAAAISPRFRPDHEFPGPPDDGCGGGQDCPGGGPAGGQDCGGSAGCQNWPGGRCGTGPVGGRDRGPGTWMPAAPGGTSAVCGRTRYPRAWAYSEATH